MFVTVSSQTELDAFNERYCHPEIKNIDFSSQALVARFLGEKHSGGYWVNLTKVEMGTGSTFVFKVTEPGDSCFVFPAFTYPYYVGIGAHLQSPFAYRDDLEKSTC